MIIINEPILIEDAASTPCDLPLARIAFVDSGTSPRNPTRRQPMLILSAWDTSINTDAKAKKEKQTLRFCAWESKTRSIRKKDISGNTKEIRGYFWDRKVAPVLYKPSNPRIRCHSTDIVIRSVSVKRLRVPTSYLQFIVRFYL